jgi:hypothetical protein
VARADRLLKGVLWDLWAATDLKDLRRRAAERDLAEAERLLAQLSRPDRLGPQESGIHAIGFDTLSSTRIPEVAEEDVPGPLRWSELARTGLRSRVVTVLLTGLAVYGALLVLYFGKGFGTVADYLLAVTWGVAAKLVIDLIAGSRRAWRRARLAATVP